MPATALSITETSREDRQARARVKAMTPPAVQPLWEADPIPVDLELAAVAVKIVDNSNKILAEELLAVVVEADLIFLATQLKPMAADAAAPVAIKISI